MTLRERHLTQPARILAARKQRRAFECECHLCSWAYFKWTIGEAEAMLRDHIETAHINPPPPYIPRAQDMPGR